MLTIPKDAAIEAAESANLDSYDESLTSTYSGRGMYGDECFGVTVSSEGQIVKFLLALGREGVDEDTIESMADKMRSDSMGRDAIYYFPGVTLDSKLDHESDDDEDDDE